jgi:hypothetical protein
MMKRILFVLVVLFALPIVSSCGLGDFEPADQVKSVRILGARVDRPYAAPGDKVELEVLAYDGRGDKKGRPMRIFWIPVPCVNPPNDLYYLCFTQLPGRQTANGLPPDPRLALLKPGIDLSPFLPTGAKYTVDVPRDIIEKHPIVEGSSAPYGMIVVFNIACAGHIEILEPDPENRSPQQVPIGCFDQDHNQLGPEDFVIGLMRVYAYETKRNANPTIERLLFRGEPVDPAVGITVDRCVANRRAECPQHDMQVILPDAAQESIPGEQDFDGKERREAVWATWFTTGGQIQFGQRLVFDARAGRVPKSEEKYIPPYEPGDYRIWSVVRDNRGGAAWIETPVHVK